MKATYKTLFSILVLSTAFSSAAFATSPCHTEHLNVKSACASDKHSPDCKAARKAHKACRAENGLAVHHRAANNPAGAPQAGATSAVPGSPDNAVNQSLPAER